MYQWDLVAYDRNQQLILAVEVKNKRNMTAQWAAQLRYNILAHDAFPITPYFLIASPDWFYLWVHVPPRSEPELPTYSIDAHPLLQPFFKRANILPEKISGQGLELIVSFWLNEVIYQSTDELDISQKWLFDSGLYEALAGGKLAHEVLV